MPVKKIRSAPLGNNALTIRGQEIPVVIEFVEHSKLQFFADNPRIYSIVRANGKDPTQEEIQEQLLQLEHVRSLVIDIRQNGGLTDPLVVKDGTFEVVEGNSRLAAYRFLAKQEPIRWAKVKCTLLPSDIDHALLFALLGQYHIKGKKDWAPYEQAGFLYRRFTEHKIDVKTLASEIGLSIHKVKHLIDTYQFMIDHNETATERWSYYDEYLKSSKIRMARVTYPDFDKLVVGKIKSGEIKRAVDVRDQLPLVCAGSSKVLKKFAAGAIDFEEAHECVLEGGGDSSHLKRVTTFRKWIVSEKAEPMLHAKGQARDKILFELNKIHSRVEALQKKLSNKD
jgi:hypothetical protein